MKFCILLLLLFFHFTNLSNTFCDQEGEVCEVLWSNNKVLHNEAQYNLNADRFLCGGENIWGICDATKTTAGDFTSISRKPDLGQLSNVTIRSVCANIYWGMAIDSDNFDVFVWGDAGNSSYHTNNNAPVRISFPGNAKIKKIGCSSTGLFALSFGNSLYAMGTGEFGELEKSKTFKLVRTDVYDFYTRDSSIVVISTDLDSNGRRYISYRGEKIDGTGGIVTTYTNISTINFPTTNEAPRIQLFDKGALFSFSGNKHYFLGKTHPSLRSDVTVPTILNFGFESMLRNEQPIDFIDRPKDGCLTIISANQFYVSGENCSSYNLVTPSIDPKLTFDLTLNDFLNTTGIVVDFFCKDTACFILTPNALLGWGKGKLGLPILPESLPGLSKITLISKDIEYLIVSQGPSNHNVLGFSRPTPISNFRTIEVNKVNKYLPVISSTDSFMQNDEFQLSISTPEVFSSVQPTVKLGNSSKMCWYDQTIDDSRNNGIWSYKNENFQEIFKSKKPWSWHVDNCGWKKTVTSSETQYKNRIYFDQFYWLQYQQSQVLLRKEEFELDVLMKFQNFIVVDANVVVERSPFKIDYFLIEKNWNISTSTGKLTVLLKHPYNLKLSNVSINYVFDSMDKFNLSIAEQENVQAYFDSPIHIPSTTTNEKDRKCFGNYCYQVFIVTYIFEGNCGDPNCFIPPNKYCDDPSSRIGLRGNLDCFDTSDASCKLGTQNLVLFSIELLQERVCTRLSQDIDLQGSIKLYEDWSHSKEKNTFAIDDWTYFYAKVDSSKAIIQSTNVSSILLQNSTYLYLNNAVTSAGTILQLQFEPKKSNDALGFHMKLKKQYFNIKYGQTVKFSLRVVLDVNYNVNKRRRNAERRSLAIEFPGSITNTGTKIEFKVGNYVETIRTPYTVFMIAGAVSAVVIGILSLLACILACLFLKCVCKGKTGTFEV